MVLMVVVLRLSSPPRCGFLIYVESLLSMFVDILSEIWLVVLRFPMCLLV